jgi:hypothetical protein
MSDTYAALAAQADRPLGPGHLDRQPLDPGHPAEPGQDWNGFDFLEKRAHENPCLGGPSGALAPIIAAKDLNGGKLNKSNQGVDGPAGPRAGNLPAPLRAMRDD